MGDNFALYDDTSHLDNATKAPDAPEKEPGANSVAVNQDGVMVDEFGLPKIPKCPIKLFGELWSLMMYLLKKNTFTSTPLSIWNTKKLKKNSLQLSSLGISCFSFWQLCRK